MAGAVVEVHDLRRTYRTNTGVVRRRPLEVEAVRGISFEVGEGELFGLLGPNGAGKTTTIKMLITLLLPTSGEARVLGLDVVDEARDLERDDAARREGALVPEDAVLRLQPAPRARRRSSPARWPTRSRGAAGRRSDGGVSVTERADDFPLPPASGHRPSSATARGSTPIRSSRRW